MNVTVDAAVAEIERACATATQIAPFSTRDRDFDVRAGYDVLAKLHERRRSGGWRPVGRKIGFTNVTLWERYGVDRPMWSHVWDRTVRHAHDGAIELSLDGLCEPRIEPEVVFALKRALPPDEDDEALLDACEWIAPGFEIVHSVFPGWRFAPADCAAAFGLHGTLGVGPRVRIDAGNRGRLASVLPTFALTLFRGGEHVESGCGANVLGSPLRALAHLRDVLATQRQFPALAAGEIVTTGTLTDAWPVQAGETWRADYGSLGVASLTARLVHGAVRAGDMQYGESVVRGR